MRRAMLPFVLFACSAHCGGSHERADADPRSLDAGRLADAPPGRRDSSAPLDAPTRPDPPDSPSTDAPAPALDAPGVRIDDAPAPATDAGRAYTRADCDLLALGGSPLNGSACIGGPWSCGIYDCHCSGAWPGCTAENVVNTNGRCDPAGCAVPGAWNDCAEYVAAGAATLARCDPRYFAGCEIPDGACMRRFSCNVLNGFVEEERRCP